VSDRLKLIREKATRPRRTVPLITNGELREQIEAVEDALARLDDAPPKDRRLSSKPDTSQRDGLLADLDALRAAAEESTLYLVLEGLSDTAWLALKKLHPPLPLLDEKPKVGDSYSVTARFNVDTIRQPLVKACLRGYRERPDADAEVLPLDAETVAWLFGFANSKQMSQLTDAAYQLCAEDDAVPLPRSATGRSASG
jgi:hypothetical protein